MKDTSFIWQLQKWWINVELTDLLLLHVIYIDIKSMEKFGGGGGGGIYRYSPTFCSPHDYIFIILDIQACEKEYLLDRAFENNVMFTILLLFSSPKKEYKKNHNYAKDKLYRVVCNFCYVQQKTI